MASCSWNTSLAQFSPSLCLNVTLVTKHTFSKYTLCSMSKRADSPLRLYLYNLRLAYTNTHNTSSEGYWLVFGWFLLSNYPL